MQEMVFSTVDARVVVPIVAVVITGIFTIIVAFINKQNAPVRDILKKTKIEGDGSLIEAIGVLQKQREKDQNIFEEQLEYYRQEMVNAREDARQARLVVSDLQLQVSQLRLTTSKQIEYLRTKLEANGIHINGEYPQ